MADVEVVTTERLADDLLAGVRATVYAAFTDFSDEDWEHALGGVHVIVRDPEVVAHAAVVERELVAGDRVLRAGYVEAVAVAPQWQRQSLGTTVMGAVAELIVDHFDIGALSTSKHDFYRRLGWESWQGPTSVRRHDGTIERTPAEDPWVMILRAPATADLALTAPISCPERPGDDW